MSDQELKLFLVEGKSSNRSISRIVNYRDNYGERYPFTEVVVAESSDEAIKQIWNAMEEKCDQHRAEVQKVIDKVVPLEKKGKFVEAAAVMEKATGFGGLNPFPPSAPRDREKWRASEVKVSGYRIKVEPE